MFDLLSNFFDIVLSFLNDIISYLSFFAKSLKLVISFPINAADIFEWGLSIFPIYLLLPVASILGIVLILRLWSIITSGG